MRMYVNQYEILGIGLCMEMLYEGVIVVRIVYRSDY